MKHFGSLLAATAFAMLPGVAEAQSLPAAVISGTRLDIVVQGSVRRIPDIAIIGAGVVTQATDAATAMRDNAARMSRVITALKRTGVADKDMSTSSISLSPQYRYIENQAPVITGYQASNQLTVRFRDIAKSGAILDTLVKEGANQINGPTLTIDQPEAAQNEARIDAIKQAKARASLYANATGLKVKRIISVSEVETGSGGPVLMQSMARDSVGSAKSEILPGEQSVGISVSVVFELE